MNTRLYRIDQFRSFPREVAAWLEANDALFVDLRHRTSSINDAKWMKENLHQAFGQRYLHLPRVLVDGTDAGTLLGLTVLQDVVLLVARNSLLKGHFDAFVKQHDLTVEPLTLGPTIDLKVANLAEMKNIFDAARILKLDVETLRHHLKTGRLRPYGLLTAGRWYFTEKSLAQFAEDHRDQLIPVPQA